MTRRLALVLLLASACARPQPVALAPAPTHYPGADWQRIADPSTVGFSRAGLDSVLTMVRSMRTSALMVVVGGRALLEYGELAETSYVASVRKSLLSMLFGRYVEDGTIRLDETLAQLGIDDVGGLLPVERTATVEDLLTARSGVYHAASNGGDALGSAPPRGSQAPGTYFLYSNWDFNALGTIFEKKTGRDIYDAFETDLARPIGMQDWHRDGQAKYADSSRSVHPAYHFVLSTRDMARLGYLMLRDGRWRGRQVVPERWVRLSTRVVVPPEEFHPESWQRQDVERGEGYGFLWWPRVRADTADPLSGSYAAEGAYGQYIYVIPRLDMVVAHKVVRREGVPFRGGVTPAEFDALVRAIVRARHPAR
jgi:CubicO group peptidase (beta-lactamase class C family)